MSIYDENIERVYITESEIQERVKKAAEWIDERFADKNPLAICILKGSVMFFCDLVRAAKTPVQIDFAAISSYGSSTVSSGKPDIVLDLSQNVAGRDVIIIEDIVDSGNTLKTLRGLLLERGAKSFTCVTLLNKPARRTVDIEPDYACFEIEDQFVVGYGLDFAQKYRTLPYIAILKPQAYKS